MKPGQALHHSYHSHCHTEHLSKIVEYSNTEDCKDPVRTGAGRRFCEVHEDYHLASWRKIGKSKRRCCPHITTFQPPQWAPSLFTNNRFMSWIVIAIPHTVADCFLSIFVLVSAPCSQLTRQKPFRSFQLVASPGVMYLCCSRWRWRRSELGTCRNLLLMIEASKQASKRNDIVQVY